MTHPSHHLNFGMNPDHARNSLSNCGIRQPKYGDRKVHHMYMRKKGGSFLPVYPILFLSYFFSYCRMTTLSTMVPYLSTLGICFQESTHWLTSCPVWGRMTPPPQGRLPAGTYLFMLSLTTGAIKGTILVINIPGRPADKKINFNCERKGYLRGNEMS